MRYARLKSGNIKYWEEILTNTTDVYFNLLVFFNWATTKTIIELLPIASELINRLSQTDYTTLINDMSPITYITKFSKKQQTEIEEVLEYGNSSEEVKYILSLRFDQTNQDKFIYKNIKKNTGVFQKAEELKFEYLVNNFFLNPQNESLLNEIKELYKSIVIYDDRQYYRYGISEDAKIPLETARLIMTNCKDYPHKISSLAEKICRQYSNEHLKPIGEIALNDKWFENN